MKQPEGNWYYELQDQLWPGRALALQVAEVLYEGRSDYQDIKVFTSPSVGRVLTLDGIVQLTESDEFSYQEMLTHIPMFAHPDPKKVLVIGGGDGGILREVARHPGVEEIHLCEIDAMVIEISKKFLPFTACGFDDPRVSVHVEDGAKFMDRNEKAFDVIIVDSSDPIGPAEVLFQKPFYESMHQALKPGGIIGTQAESMWLHKELIQGLLNMARTIFKNVGYAFISIPTYPTGTIGILTASDESDLRSPLRKPDEAIQAALRYYSPEIHQTAFQLPAFAKDL